MPRVSLSGGGVGFGISLSFQYCNLTPGGQTFHFEIVAFILKRLDKMNPFKTGINACCEGANEANYTGILFAIYSLTKPYLVIGCNTLKNQRGEQPW
jgi:hypothetical protein